MTEKSVPLMTNVTRSHEDTKYRRYNDRVSQSVFHREECLIQYAYFTHSFGETPGVLKADAIVRKRMLQLLPDFTGEAGIELASPSTKET
ncbi:hypothetical protein J6590_028949 [Homalodisca vitripennis]|nr:hypothetical protein J6590_028949 [Homalodisca vitripennis]